METIAYIASALIGISLGLIGGGGSILTVPVLVYLFGISPILSTSYSLFIVGSTSLVGAISNYRKGLVSIKTALLFGLSSITTVFITRKYLIPLIPDHLFTIGGFTLTRNIVTMVLFAVLMIVAASAMIRSGNKTEPNNTPEKELHIPKLLITGIAIGLATGILGAGGGFLLIPTLVLLVGLPMKEAIGTSLLIIALNSLIGFTGDIGHFQINWIFLLKITTIAISGIFAGGALSRKINGQKLKKGFGWFVLMMGSYIIIKELILK
ncbi:sulfite exporter TauE/SafE family protein [Mucilaginibacter sp. RS28]|uniref:Probable membrane transporter protein n=1 Tax=Mucilaginibacter straminoryzae TaxID=2932774 RepID=A0A9X1WZP1_9SPHI|nr:sulfite exporter TauE/SafE family protein [Mucilaginibacter straminoryzae]MCJ8208582.1 sulfite exporter TauE/SafE family protein [Mucilaginibacter straminoryzae]